MGRPGLALWRELPGHVHSPGKLLGPLKLLTEARRKPLQLHSPVFETTHRSPNVIDSDVIGAFLAGTSCRDLVSKLGRKTPTKANEMMDITTKFASGQEAVEALFHKDKGVGKRKEGAPEASTQCNPKKGKKKKM
jgi:hypothetical protein